MTNTFKKIKSALILAFVLMAASCSSDFLDTAPTDSVSYSEGTSTAAGLMNIINGIHRDMYVRTPYGQGYNGQTGSIVMFDSMAEDLVHTTTGLNWHIADVRWLTQDVETSGSVAYPWRFYYKIINNANIVIKEGPAVVIPTGPSEATDKATKEKAIGEAYAYRAWALFQIVQIYGKNYIPGGANTTEGAILRLTPGEEPMARSTVEQTYTQINADLNQALVYLTGTGKTRAHKSHFDPNVVKGIMARVYLNQGRYAEAATMANQARAGYPLMSNAEYVLGFNKVSSNEWIWGSEVVSDQTDYFGNFGAYMSRNYNSSTIRTAPKAIYKPLYDKFPTTDIRTKVFDPTGNHTSLNLPSSFTKRPYTSQKFLAVSVSDSRCDVPYMRSGELYLLEAEALARDGNITASKTVFTQFMQNRNPSYTTSASTGTVYLEEILDSRRIELWGEGFRWFDLKRMNRGVKRDDTGTNHVASVVNNVWNISSTDNRWQLKIPRAELDANPLCKQNP